MSAYKTVLITLKSTTSCPSPVNLLQVAVEEALMIHPKVTQQTRLGDWYLDSITLAPQKKEIPTIKVAELNKMFDVQFIPNVKHGTRERPVG